MLVEKPAGTRQLGEGTGRWENNIKMELQETGWKVIHRIDLAQYKDRCWAVVNEVINLCVP
jgi:hypothetical protein